MIEAILSAIQDLFGGDDIAMWAMAVILLACGAGAIFLHFKGSREAVARRVSDSKEKRAPGNTPDATFDMKKSVSAVVGKLARTAGQADHDQSRVLRARLIQAGYYDRQAVIWFFGARLAGLIFGALLCFLAATQLLTEASGAAQGMSALMGALLGFIAPSFALDKRINRLKLEHSSGFPDFMDLMVVCAQAGLSMEASINRIAGEIAVAYPSLASNLENAARELRSGKSLAMTIDSLAKRLGIQEAAAFSTLLQQSEELGSSLTQSLRTYADDMRNKRLMKAEEKAYALPAKLVVPLTLFVFPVLLVVLMLPVVVSVSKSGL